MDKDKGSINVFEVKIAKKDIPYKISAADVFNDYLYIGDQKGNIYSYPIRPGDSQVIPKNTQQQSKAITKAKIDKILCYRPISLLIVLSDQKLLVIDLALKKIQQIASKIHDFALNEPFSNEESLNSIVAISRKKEGMIFFFNPVLKKFQDTKSRFQINELPTCVSYTGYTINLGYKKDYEALNIEKSFAVKKGPLQAKSPFQKVTGKNEVLFFSDDIGIFMEPEFMPKQKDNIFVNKAIINITQCKNYYLILCQGLLQVYSSFESKKFNLIQQIPFNNVRGITNERPFVFGRQQLYFLYEEHYEKQIKKLLEKGRVDDALYLLVQNVGENQEKMEEIKMDAVWPLIKKMEFSKAKQLLMDIQFDIRELILLFPELINVEIQSLKNGKADKTMSTMIYEYLSQKPNKTKDEEADLKRKSKLFLKDVLQHKRQAYTSNTNNPTQKKRKINFNYSKQSLIRTKLEDTNSQDLLQVIDFTLIKWFLEMSYFRQLEEFFLNNPIVFCKDLFQEIQTCIKNNAKLAEFPTLKPRLYMAFDRIDEAYEGWKVVAENNPKQALIKTACEESVKLLASFSNKEGILKKLQWILKRNPEAAMSFFKMVDINFIRPDDVIAGFEQEKQYKYLELYLEAYHTKLLLLYIDQLFSKHGSEQKQQSKDTAFQEKLVKMRKLLRNPEAKYASEPVLKKIENCPWLMQDESFLYARQKRHKDALQKFINKNMYTEAQKYCKENRDKTLTIYFEKLLAVFLSYERKGKSDALFVKKDIILFLKKYSSDPQLDPVVVLELIPDTWLLNDNDGVGGIYQFLQSAIIHTLHEKRTAYTSKHLSEMDLLTSQYNLIEAKRAFLRFTYKKKCLKCDMPIADKFFVVYPNANVFHQSCAKGEKNTVCPKTNQDFEKTFKY